MAVLALDDAAAWTAAALPEVTQAIFREKLVGFTVAADAGAAQFVSGLAQHLQLLGDITPSLSGVHAFNEEKGEATIFFAAMDPFLAEVSLANAMQMVSAIASGQMPAATHLDKCIERVLAAALDQSTRLVIEEAERRDIPWFRISARARYVQLGQGARQRRIFETLRSVESPIGRELSRDKLLTFQILGQLGLPVGRSAAVRTVESALRNAEKIGYPIVLKPVRGQKGRLVFANLRNAQELRAVLARVDRQGQFLLQSFFPGEDHRILIVDGKMVAAARRIAAGVIGDGQRSVTELVHEANKDPRRGSGFSNLMNFIVLDDEADRMLRRQSLTRDSVSARGQYVRLRSTANIATGGTSLDVSDIIHPDNVRAAVRAAKTLELSVAGVDFISPDISKSWREVGGGICEVNAVVGVRVHRLANPDTDVVGPLIETVYPNRQNGRIPTAMITGSKGKSTTTKMLHAILTAAGHVAGMATTDGVVIGNEEVAIGDLAGYPGATIVLRDPTVTAAALETARGGLIKNGTYLDWCNVAALTCVDREQIQVDGIDTVEQMATLKRKVLEAARDAVVLNADDVLCAGMLAQFAGLRTIIFSMNAASSVVSAHLDNGGEAIVRNKSAIEIRKGSQSVRLIDIADMPSTMNGIIEANIMNAMTAVGLGLGLGIAHEPMREALKRYDNSPANAGCRFSLVNGFPFKVMFDRAAQAPAYKAILPFLKTLPATGKKICLCSHAGNRPYWSTQEGAAVLAGNFDHYLCFDRVPYRRGKQPGEIATNIAKALKEHGVAPASISIAETTEEAARALVSLATPDDFAVVFCADAHGFVEKFRSAFEEGEKK